MIALVDCNNFYASCERVFNPMIRNKPIVVLSNNDGCVIARSNEAKMLGIKMGDPAFKIHHIFIKHSVYIYSTNFALYGDLSKRVMSILSDSVPRIEIYSIDEAFLDYKRIYNPEEKALLLKEKILKWTGIPVSIGIAKTKTLAKVANRIAKRNGTSDIFKLTCQKNIMAYLRNMSVSKLWGVGNKYACKLAVHGVHTAYDLVQKSDNWIKRYMSITGLKMVKELRGIPCFELENTWKRKKSIRTSRTFNKNIKDFNSLVEAVSTYASMCATKLRQQQSCADTITIFISSNFFNRHNQSYYKGIKTMKLKMATNDSIEIVSASISGLKEIYRGDYLYKKAGVIVSGIVSYSQVQLTFFDNTLDIDKRHRMMQAIDTINNRYGKRKIHLAINGFERDWKLRQEHLSPCYTTCMKELLRVAT